MNVKALMRNTPSECFQEWIAAYKNEPWGDDWQQTADIACAAINPHIKKPLTRADFIPFAKQAVGMTDLDEMEQALANMCVR